MYSSRSSFTGQRRPCVLGFVKEIEHLLPGNRGKAGKEVVDRFADSKIIEQRLHRHPRAAEDRRSTHDLGIARYDGFLHAGNVILGERDGNYSRCPHAYPS